MTPLSARWFVHACHHPAARLIALLIGLALFAGIGSARPRELGIPSAHPDGLASEDGSAPFSDYHVSGLLSASDYDTSWYGGTVWAADSNRWEAIPGGIWTFDSGVGSAIQTTPSPTKPVGYHRLMEGWTGLITGLTEPTDFRRMTTCVIAGSYSMWAGRTLAEANARCWPGGQGYGNGVNTSLEQTFAYSGTGNVTLQFKYAVDAEPGFDDLSLLVRPSGAANDVVLT
ncbi:MAG TPA: hypothetical protein VF720_05905, partial [Candidatus Eisenbacteria bacterium]